MSKPLFCLRIAGPDDVIAAPSELQASDAADEFNRHYRTPEMHAFEDAWPYGAESHAHGVTKDWPQYESLARAGRKRRLAGELA